MSESGDRRCIYQRRQDKCVTQNHNPNRRNTHLLSRRHEKRRPKPSRFRRSLDSTQHVPHLPSEANVPTRPQTSTGPWTSRKHSDAEAAIAPATPAISVPG